MKTRRLLPLVLLGTACTVPPPSPEGRGGADSAASVDSAAPDDTAPPVDTAPPDDTGDTGTLPLDTDGDGWSDSQDCEPTEPTVHPGAPDVCGDGHVNDCSGSWELEEARCKGQLFAEAQGAAYFGGTFQRVRGVGDINGDGKDDLMGSAVAATGDIDGDGVLDAEAYLAGAVFLVTDAVEGHILPEHVSAAVYGNEFGGQLGWDIVGLGDVNGDGYGDIAVGASEQDRSDYAWDPVFRSQLFRIDGPVDINNIGDALLMLDAEERMTCTGSVLETMADQDGDGARELLVGSRCAGEVHLLSAGVNETQERGDSIAELVGPDGDSRFGHAFNSGDLDGDGIDDIVVGAPERHDLGIGFVSVFEGPVEGTVSHLDAGATHTVEGSASMSGATLFGSGVGLGDVDGDGALDLAASAPVMNDEYSTPLDGAVFVYFNPLESTSSVNEADVRISGYYREAEGGFQPEAEWAMNPVTGHWGVGGPVHASTDLDGDALPDLLFGCGWSEVNGARASFTGSSSRRAWVFSGPMIAGSYWASDADYHLGGDPNPASTRSIGAVLDILGDTDGDGRPEISLTDSNTGAYLFELTETPFP